MRVFLTACEFGIGYELTPVNKQLAEKQARETGDESVRVTSDWDFPALAYTLGWNMGRTTRCDHSSTDGTIECKGCGRSPHYFVSESAAWLDKRVGSVIQRAGIEMYFQIH